VHALGPGIKIVPNNRGNGSPELTYALLESIEDPHPHAVLQPLPLPVHRSNEQQHELAEHSGCLT